MDGDPALASFRGASSSRRAARARTAGSRPPRLLQGGEFIEARRDRVEGGLDLPSPPSGGRVHRGDLTVLAAEAQRSLASFRGASSSRPHRKARLSGVPATLASFRGASSSRLRQRVERWVGLSLASFRGASSSRRATLRRVGVRRRPSPPSGGEFIEARTGRVPGRGGTASPPSGASVPAAAARTRTPSRDRPGPHREARAPTAPSARGLEPEHVLASAPPPADQQPRVIVDERQQHRPAGGRADELGAVKPVPRSTTSMSKRSRSASSSASAPTPPSPGWSPSSCAATRPSSRCPARS